MPQSENLQKLFLHIKELSKKRLDYEKQQKIIDDLSVSNKYSLDELLVACVKFDFYWKIIENLLKLGANPNTLIDEKTKKPLTYKYTMKLYQKEMMEEYSCDTIIDLLIDNGLDISVFEDNDHISIPVHYLKKLYMKNKELEKNNTNIIIVNKKLREENEHLKYSPEGEGYRGAKKHFRENLKK